MSKKPSSFDWDKWESGNLPELGPHSVAKLRVLQDYVEDYINILCSDSFGQDLFKITLVDGFSGGGIYKGDASGSPFTLIRAVEAAEARLNSDGRKKKITIDCQYHFVDENPRSIACLIDQLEKRGYKHKLNQSIFLYEGEFENQVSKVLSRIKTRHPRTGARVIFFLDQFGYTKVRPATLKSLSKELHDKAEFIVNFAIEWLMDFMGDKNQFKKIFPQLGIEEEIKADRLLDLKDNGGVHWKYLVESLVGPAFMKASGSPFFSPFYIEPAGSHRGYWLLHLAPHDRARSAMLDVYWRHANSHKHYGHMGIDMLAFKAEADNTGYLDGISFNAMTRDLAKTDLQEDFSKAIHTNHSDGIKFLELAKKYSNRTIANHELLAEVINQLVALNELKITGPSGKSKRSLSINNEDIILPCKQLSLFQPKKKII